MDDIVLLVWGLSTTLIVCGLLYYAFQALDFSKLFKANSTLQIKIIIVLISLSCGIICGIGMCKLLNLLLDIFN